MSPQMSPEIKRRDEEIENQKDSFDADIPVQQELRVSELQELTHDLGPRELRNS